MNVIRFLVWMRERGWSVYFCGSPETRIYNEAQKCQISVIEIRSQLKAGDFVNAWRLSQSLSKDNIRFLVVNRSFDFFLTVAATIFTGKKIKLISQQHMHIGGQKRDPYHAWLYRQFDAWVTPVKWLADRVLEKTTIPSERVHIIPLGIVLNHFVENLPDRIQARTHLSLPKEAVIIGLVGRLDQKKGQHILIKAAAKLHKAGYPVHLLFVGAQSFSEGDNYVREINDLTNSLNLQKFIHFRPYEVRVEYAYAPLNIFVLASKSECYGMVTIEAMASGLPVVATNDGGTISIVDNNHNGKLVKPFDVDELADALKELLDNRSLSEALGTKGQATAIELYSHTRQCELWEELLRQLK